MITIEIQSLIIGMICAYAVSCMVKVWKGNYEKTVYGLSEKKWDIHKSEETKTDTKKAKSSDGKVAEQ